MDYIKVPVICMEAILALADAERGRLLKAVLERQAGLTICKEAERVGSVTKKNAAKRCVREVPARRYVIRSTERHTIKGKMRSICRGSAMTGSEKRL